ncbi:MAG: DMT family transporter [Alphaproteobacteria bacterium]|nr:DMT family transporter [Alphaproteobacteria bacterium]
MLVLATGFLFSISDTLSKLLTQTIPVFEIAWLRFGAFVAMVVPAALIQGRAGLRSSRPSLQILRGLGVTGSSIFFNFGVVSLPIADATVIGFASPIFITALSIPLLGEKVGIRRWSAVVVGLIGIIVVARPGAASFNPAAIFPLLSSMSWSIGMIFTRKLSASDPPLAIMAYSAVTGFVVLSLLLPYVWVPPSLTDIALGLCVGIASTSSHWVLIAAYRRADVSLLAPFSYIQIIWASILGFLFFGALPGPTTLVGAAIIAASGIYTAHRERMAAKRRLDQRFE